MSDNVVDYLREQFARLNARLDDMSHPKTGSWL